MDLRLSREVIGSFREASQWRGGRHDQSKSSIREVESYKVVHSTVVEKGLQALVLIDRIQSREMYLRCLS